MVTPKQMKQFEKLARPLIKFLNDEFHPHTGIIIDCSNAQIVEGIASFPTTAYIKD